MPVATAIRPFISVDEYLAGERANEIRHEYIDGRVYAMTGASRAHGLIVNALASGSYARKWCMSKNT